MWTSLVQGLQLYWISTGMVEVLSHQRSLQVEGLSILKEQHDISFQVTQTAVTMTPNPLLQQQVQSTRLEASLPVGSITKLLFLP